jgi:hypothetical protein
MVVHSLNDLFKHIHGGLRVIQLSGRPIVLPNADPALLSVLRDHGATKTRYRVDHQVGAVSESVTDEEARAMVTLCDMPCDADLRSIRFRTHGNLSRPSYELIRLRLVESENAKKLP